MLSRCPATEMRRPSRPPNPTDGSTAITASEGSEGDPQPVGAAGASAPTSRSKNVRERSSTGEGESDSPSWCRPRSRLGVFHTRTIFHLPRRSSSGYFSFESDSLPSSPLSPRPVTVDIATQTPSLTGQVMQHALQRMAAEHGGGPGTHHHHGQSLNPSSPRQRNAGDMQAEALGRELRRIGDDYNRLLVQRRAGAHREAVIPLNLLPHMYPEPVAMLCVGLLLLLFGRIMYLQGSTNSQDHSQV
ncbi:bcl-2-like protein 11 [Mugil cephalus]|uniref:bcl-2-like protein 11 n=1 Tax=Mugil cephalus TaxID=48193 RepID=UPI001FB639C1|nr:bcl-2-like protein 11 [Mugil cephalus]